MGHSNPIYVGAESVQANDPFDMEVFEIQKCGHYCDLNYLSQDGEQGGTEHDYEQLHFNQSEA